ncbi:MAG: hypothetical protein SO253_02310 [Bacilli bacterium]|nr:hypothetical protein [Bacilli bacterium]
MRKYLPILIGLGISLVTMLFTFLVWGSLQNDYYMWGVMQAIFSIGYFALGWFTGGLINRNIRKEARSKLADTSYRNPTKAQYKLFIHTCYFAGIFGIIISFIGYYAFGMGKYIPPIETILQIL